ncbi:hypothetical protein V8E51_006835 [Hyaloscypha variabilis]
MSTSISDQADCNTALNRAGKHTMKQTKSTTLATSSNSAPGTSRKYMKNLRDLFVQGEDLHLDPTFHLFPKFPLELRLKVWKNAIFDIPPRVICIQPISNDGVPAVLQVCRESRQEAKKTFMIVESGQPNLPFTLLVNFQKDTIYLNRNFKAKGVERFPSALQTASHFYKDAMKEVRLLAMNLEDIHCLTSAYRDNEGKRDLWQMLHENCPKLKKVVLVIDGPQKGRTVTHFRSLYQISNCNLVEFSRRHPKLVSVLESKQKAKKKAICKKVRIEVKSIDQAKKLPMRYGEKDNNDGSGVYDSYGISDRSMRWVLKAVPLAQSESG